MTQSSPIINWGILSCARVARRRWIPALKSLPDTRIAAIASRDKSKARNWANELDIETAYGDYESLLTDKRIDAIFIGLPNSLHQEWAIKALEAGKHVLCDKPLCLNAAEAQTITRAAQRAGRLLMEGFSYHYHLQYPQLQSWLAENAIGAIRHISVSFSFMSDNEGNIRSNPALGGGVRLDLGCYCVHLIRLLTGQEPQVTAASQVIGPTGVDIRTQALLKLPCGATASFDCAFDHFGGRQLTIGGSTGRIYSSSPFSGDLPATLTLQAGDHNEQLTFPPGSPYAACIAEFHTAIRSGQPTPSMSGDSVNNMRILDAIAQAAAS